MQIGCEYKTLTYYESVVRQSLNWRNMNEKKDI